jgi:UDPglucose--hexose-1-phosphate uridylyltransferase
MNDSFPQLRKDPVIDRWTLIAPERAARPTEIEDPGHLAHHTACPFCEGHEAETPHEVLAVRTPGSPTDGPGWRVRVVPNRFPAARPDAGPVRSPHDLLVAEPGVGVHEVVIEAPHHEASISALPVEHVRDVFAVYRDRLALHGADRRLRHVQVFKNHGAPAGASVEHVHSQILATGRIPLEIEAELDRAATYHAPHGDCVYCDLLDRELAAGERIVLESEHVVAFAAWAGRFPYETWVLPRRHAASYERLSNAELTDLAGVMRTVLRRLSAVAGDPAYNYVLHTTAAEPFHWHWEILPRLTGIAGYELATGCYLNPLPPEEAAERLRKRG